MSERLLFRIIFSSKSEDQRWGKTPCDKSVSRLKVSKRKRRKLTFTSLSTTFNWELHNSLNINLTGLQVYSFGTCVLSKGCMETTADSMKHKDGDEGGKRNITKEFLSYYTRFKTWKKKQILSETSQTHTHTTKNNRGFMISHILFHPGAHMETSASTWWKYLKLLQVELKLPPIHFQLVDFYYFRGTERWITAAPWSFILRSFINMILATI